MRLAVLVPAYNEEAYIEAILRRVLDVCRSDDEVVAVDDGSTDATGTIIERLAAEDSRLRFLRHDRNRGKGAAVRTALAAATADVVVIQDADLEYDPADYQALLKPLERGDADLVLGARDLGPHSCLSLWYYCGVRFLNAWFDALYGVATTDVLTCYKVFRRELLDVGALRSTGFGLDMEIPARLVRGGARVFEVPVYYAARPTRDGKKIRWWHGFGMAWAALRFRFL